MLIRIIDSPAIPSRQCHVTAWYDVKIILFINSLSSSGHILIKVRMIQNIIYRGLGELSADPVIQLIYYEWPY